MTPPTVYFEASVSAFDGSSGAPIVNMETGVVEGIETRGSASPIYDGDRQCFKVSMVSPLAYVIW
jgi:hypothetical protein